MPRAINSNIDVQLQWLEQNLSEAVIAGFDHGALSHRILVSADGTRGEALDKHRDRSRIRYIRYQQPEV
jgi:acyl-homoserine lactone acylase PvdQ